MSKVHITVEMTEKEYEEYQKLITGTHKSQDLTKISIHEFFEAHGLKESGVDSEFSAITRENIQTMRFSSVDGKTILAIQMREKI